MMSMLDSKSVSFHRYLLNPNPVPVDAPLQVGIIDRRKSKNM